MEHGKPFEMQTYNHSEDSLVKRRDAVVKELRTDMESDEPSPSTSEDWKSSMDRFWLLETVSLFVSTGALVGIVAILRAYDNNPLPQWSTSRIVRVRNDFTKDYALSVTLNSVLSLIATVFKISLGIPVAASLGQLKWDWFADGHTRKLADFQMFDSARGALGSLTLLWTLRGRRLACLAAVVTLGSLALDFAFQSLVNYPLTRVPISSVPTASLAVATHYKDYAFDTAGGQVFGASGVVQSMLGNIYTGIFNFNGSASVSPSCSTGDCMWNISSTNPVTSYASLGVCGECQDSTAHLQKTCGTRTTAANFANAQGITPNLTAPYCNYTLPNGLSLTGDAAFPSFPFMKSSGEPVNNTQFQQIANPISILSIIRAAWTNRIDNGTEFELPPKSPGPPSASYLRDATSTECALYMCIRLHTATVVKGVFKEEIIDTFRNDISKGFPLENVTQQIDNCNKNWTITVPGQWHLDAKAPKTFTITHCAWNGLDSFRKIWKGNVTAFWTAPDETNREPSSDVIQTMYGLNDTGVQKTIDNLAQSMTMNMRQTSGEFAKGTAFQSIPYVSVQWAWMALPVTLLLIASILLTSTIVRTRSKGTHLWKGSSLATFYHPLTETGRNTLKGARNGRQLEKISGSIPVKWTSTNGERTAFDTC